LFESTVKKNIKNIDETIFVEFRFACFHTTSSMVQRRNVPMSWILAWKYINQWLGMRILQSRTASGKNNLTLGCPAHRISFGEIKACRTVGIRKLFSFWRNVALTNHQKGFKLLLASKKNNNVPHSGLRLALFHRQ